MYKFIDSELIAVCDVDDTIVMHHPDSLGEAITITDPYTKTNIDLKIHRKHVKLIKDFKARGYTVIVWSHGGPRWAKSVVDALGLEKYVDIVMAKPAKTLDDLTPDKILGTVIYLKND